jgi:hypothetical protein
VGLWRFVFDGCTLHPASYSLNLSQLQGCHKINSFPFLCSSTMMFLPCHWHNSNGASKPGNEPFENKGQSKSLFLLRCLSGIKSWFIQGLSSYNKREGVEKHRLLGLECLLCIATEQFEQATQSQLWHINFGGMEKGKGKYFRGWNQDASKFNKSQEGI